MKLVKDNDKELEVLNVKAFINLMRDCPDSINMLVVDRVVLQTMIAMIEAANDKRSK
jgi:hypothetical protein